MKMANSGPKIPVNYSISTNQNPNDPARLQSTPSDHRWKAHAGVRGDCLNRAVVPAYVTILAIPLIGNPGFVLLFVHPQNVAWTPFNASAAADAFTFVDDLNGHD